MEPKVTAIAAVPEPQPPKIDPTAKVEQVTPAADAKKAGQEKARRDPEPQPAPDQVEMRLVIEMDQATGTYVYKTINRQTGEVVMQLPRAEVLKLRDGPQYAAGTVVRTKA
jgi:flagellar protein FlaG